MRPGAAGEHWGDYPTPSLRILFNAEVLRQTGFAAAADDVVKRWRLDYTQHEMGAFVPDIPGVVAGLLGAQLLPAKFGFKNLAAQEASAQQTFDFTGELNLQERIDPRALVAISTKIKADGWPVLLRHMARSRPPGVLDLQEKRVRGARKVETTRLASLLFDGIE